jgi:dTDP-4-amino-4,6-dideoxygalactose transaminase
MEDFRKLADEHGLWIIEDACHAPGGYFVDATGAIQHCGNGKYADLAIFSFHPVKHIATGEGGMITTNDEKLYEKLKVLRTHGITRDPAAFTNPIALAGGDEAYPGWYMEMQTLGYNYRLTDFQAALGISQLKRADDGMAKRRAIAAMYNSAFEGKGFIKRQSGVVEGHAYHLYIMEVPNRLGLYNHLRKHDIFAQIHYIPCHLMPYYARQGWKQGDLPHAEAYYEGCISLPMYPTLDRKQVEHVVRAINAFYVA